MLCLDEVTNAIWKKWGLVIQDWYFGEGKEKNSKCEKDKKEGIGKIMFKNYVYTWIYTIVKYYSIYSSTWL